MRLSLILPTYNRAGYLRETLASVLDRITEEYEVIVIDDGSDDETALCLGEFEGISEQIQIHYLSHRGVSIARNTGIEYATGDYVAFLDCDDTLKPAFFEECKVLLESKKDLYVLGYDRIEADGQRIPFWLRDHVYENPSDFADDYIRMRHLLVYSACNKLYRRDILDRFSIRFRESLSFGEDRLFNYDYIKKCRSIVTSSIKMFNYIQRNTNSASNRSLSDYYDIIMMLHKAKMQCFISLSCKTSVPEKAEFAGNDLSNEIRHMLGRFQAFPDEKKENLSKINNLIFGKMDDYKGRFDYILVLGSSNCAYRAEKAFEIGGADSDTVFILSGGNPSIDGVLTEAEHMRKHLLEKGIPDNRILVEKYSRNTRHNLEYSASLIRKDLATGKQKNKEDLRIAIITAGFHIHRTKLIFSNNSWLRDKNVVFIPAFGTHTRLDN
ncbi:glycosyltransferase [Butyrivibrio sp. AE3004]|uniref:glycosyltransferase n=1 Tax=Butyrivibrio sp. AE3004 TaxID=1506994 RepID=UPI00049496AE|nr:glycosyltransferase [Butyrivibrio sp. AE3004]